ncbi:Hpt domain-containing protein [Lacipirellula parvula]|uniref:HPt domain-containing protein n=1 Tax=Lacipirellula parvula TaxID=2650471 RepID=A0A5K7XEC5_9BACT|nr:Hpt domain-containing protein [Lacipirellula parvula]BBO35214.1 hypothetical protein PLANPX_4826 [Lacipirellula parvula]
MTTSSSDGEEGLGELLAMYASEMPARIESIRKAVATNNREQLKRLFHQLVGSAGSYGFDSLSVEARKVELALGANASIDDLLSDIDAVLRLCERVIAK